MDRSAPVEGAPSTRLSPLRSSPATTSATVASGRFRLTTGAAIVACALTPAYTIRWHIGPLPTTLLENAIWLTVAAFAFESWRDRTVPRWNTRVTLPALVFLIAGAISIFVAPDHRAAAGLYRAYMIEPIAFGLVLVNAITTPQRAVMVAGALLLGGVVAGAANSAVVLRALAHHTYDVVQTPPVVIYNTANAVALYLVPLVAFAGAVLLHWPGRRERLIAGVLLAVGVVCVVLSFSRGGYLALAVVAVGLALSHGRRWILLGAGAAVALALMLVPVIRRRVETEVNLSDPHNTLVGRSHLWAAALQMLHDHTIFGAGLSGFATAIAPYWNATHPDRFTYPHNIVLNFWTETGLLGVAAFAAILGAAFARSWGGWRRADVHWRSIHLGVLLALLAVVVHGLVDVPYWKNDLSLEFWALVGLTLSAAALTGTGSARRATAAAPTQTSSPRSTARP
jgi:O-antigen ligase